MKRLAENLKPLRHAITKQSGSITVEASLVFPLFCAIILLLVNIINVAIVQISMDYAVSETAKKIAAYSFPLKYLKEGTDFALEKTNISKYLENAANMEQGSKSSQILSGQLMSSSNIILNSWRNFVYKGAGSSIEEIIKKIAQKEICEIYPLGNLGQTAPFSISGFKIYNPFDMDSGNGTSVNGELDKEDVRIVVDYKVKVFIPFCPLKEIKMRSMAIERAWVD